MKGYLRMTLKSVSKDERGSSFYSFLGFLVLIAVIIGAIFLIPWGEFGGRPQDPNYVAAMAAMEKKQWNEAISLFDKSIQNDPENTAAYIGRSRAYLQLGNLEKAFDDADTAVQKKATAKAYGQRALVQKLQKKMDEATKDFTEAIRLDSNYAWAYAQRADVYSKNKDQEKALADVNKAISIKPDFVDAYRLRAWVQNKRGNCKEAAEDFLKVEKLSPNDAWSIQDRAWFLLTCPDEKLQDTSKAMELAKKALDLVGGKDGMFHETLAEAFFRQGDPLKAAEHQKKAIELGSQKCPDGSCLKEMQQRLQKYELAARQEIRQNYEILPMDSGL